jgi:phospholipid/cholesterol/gamma-HCH transport system substrate-binding protein
VKPFRQRNHLVIGMAGIAVIVLGVLAAFNADQLPVIGGGDEYSAEFTDASGLVTDNEVRIAGVKVGKVTGIDLTHHDGKPAVRVDFRVDRDVSFGTKTEATIRIKTVLGQKFLSLEPDGPGAMQPGQQIPRSRTSSPFDVVQAVNGLADTVDKIDTKQLAKAFDTLSATLEDTAPNVKGSIHGLSRLSRTVASRDDALRQLLRRARGVTQVLADRDKQFQQLLTDGNKLLKEVKARRDAIHQLLVSTDELAKQLSGLVTDNQKQLEPALKQLRQVVQVLQDNRDNLTKSIRNMAPFLNAFTNVLGNGRWFDSYIDALLQPYTVGAPPARPQGGDRAGSAVTQTGSRSGQRGTGDQGGAARPKAIRSAGATPSGGAAPSPAGTASPSTTASPGR